MTKADLVEGVTLAIEKTSGPMISKKDCARVVDAFLDAIKDALKEQRNIEVRGFGTFKIRQRKTRMARNPRTGAPVEVSARPVPVFKPSKELRALVAEAEKIIAQSGSAPSVLSGLRERFERAQHRLGDLTDEARKRVVAGAKATDETIREHPYQSIAVALGAGLIVGVLLGRRSATR